MTHPHPVLDDEDECNHHPEVENDCDLTDNDRISWDSL
jgi:hypothetical protein